MSLGVIPLPDRSERIDGFVLKSSYDRLQAENAKLREERREYQATIDSLVDECAEHKAENAKLRELVLDMWHLMDGSGVTTGAWGRCVQILDRMRELGVEVSDD